MKLYHATYKAHIESIMYLGLGAKQPKNWDFSEDGLVYFARCPHVAESYAECADDVDDEIGDSGIVVIQVDTKHVPMYLFETDKNNQQGDTLTFEGVIPPKYLEIVNMADH